MDQYGEILKQHANKQSAKVLKKHGIICKQMPFGDSPAPLYMAKPHWTNRFDEKRESTNGIFCSIWISPSLLKENKFAYNIHSKAIRTLPGYALTSQDFAKEFRRLVKTKVSKWPGIRLDHGPTTLLQGKDECQLDSFAEKIEERIQGFVDIHEHIDDLLEAAVS